MKIEEVIRDIRKRCRLAMNGVVSTSMREQGLNYKLNFGVSFGKIREIAANYESDKDLAENLWKENVRELKILATLLYPPTDFDEITANRWVREIPNQEIREQACFNLFQKSPDAVKLALMWSNDNSEEVRATGYWLLTRLLIIKKKDINAGLALYLYILSDIESNNISLRNAAISALKQIGRISKDNAEDILGRIDSFQSSSDSGKKEIFDSLKFEFEYYYDDPQ